MFRYKIIFILLIAAFFSNCAQKPKPNINYKAHTFYYNWFGNPEKDGKYYHWEHDILPHWSDTTWNNAGKFPGKENIGANYYPELGTYSSNETELIKKHMQMIQQSGIGVLVITWWGKDSYEDKSINTYLNIAENHGLKIAFHIEPFYKTVEEFKTQLDYLKTQYGNHSALYKVNNKPFYYVYDSYKLEVNEWQKLLSPEGEFSIRNTELDALFIGLWVEKDHGNLIKESGFDGFYTYFASDAFVYGSTSKNWKSMSAFAEKNQLLFIPCAGPGYIDTRIRPWNNANTKPRNMGLYYENMFNAALEANPNYIGITSFNEWHEGTQIEPSISKKYKDYKYEDFSETNDTWFYIKKTKELVNTFQ